MPPPPLLLDPAEERAPPLPAAFISRRKGRGRDRAAPSVGLGEEERQRGEALRGGVGRGVAEGERRRRHR
uniref:Uncharacterized protein n=1 Tax=Oryza sativa subsp. japonica TaxID=39947 RepID=Q7XB64_ORYSJ|nr:hypothetical protein [Oryza sativa Japonica Group]